jgi:hypothetical protein
MVVANFVHLGMRRYTTSKDKQYEEWCPRLRFIGLFIVQRASFLHSCVSVDVLLDAHVPLPVIYLMLMCLCQYSP